jgi:hypothetical protein
MMDSPHFEKRNRSQTCPCAVQKKNLGGDYTRKSVAQLDVDQNIADFKVITIL